MQQSDSVGNLDALHGSGLVAGAGALLLFEFRRIIPPPPPFPSPIPLFLAAVKISCFLRFARF